MLTGEGDFFCAGADLTDPPAKFFRALPDVGVDIGKPVVTAVNGPAIGLGLALLAYSDLAVASRSARFVYPEAKVGVALGLMSGLATRIPHKVAMELLLLGEPISAERAHEVGLVNRLAEPGNTLDEALRMAQGLAANAPLVVKMLKGLVRDTLPRSPVEVAFHTQGRVDAVVDSADAQEGLLAFREKRPPTFTGQ